MLINLAEEWRRLDGRRRKPDSQDHWDERAKSFSFKDAPDTYLRSFISKAGITGKETVLDMGCGTGSLAVALAAMGCSVVAADFSKGMLDRLHSKAAERGCFWKGERLDLVRTTFLLAILKHAPLRFRRGRSFLFT